MNSFSWMLGFADERVSLIFKSQNPSCQRQSFKSQFPKLEISIISNWKLSRFQSSFITIISEKYWEQKKDCFVIWNSHDVKINANYSNTCIGRYRIGCIKNLSALFSVMKHLRFCSNPDDQMERKMTTPQVEITCIEFGFVSNRMPPSCTMNTGCGEFRWKFISNWNAFSSLYFPGAGRSNFKFDSCISIPNSQCCQFQCVN